MPEVLSVEMGAVLEASIKDLEEQVEKVLADNRPKHPKSFYDLPLKFDPGNCVISDHRLFMLCALEVGGMPALVKYLYAYARDRIENNDPMFKYFIDEEESKSPGLPLIISTIHPEVLVSLIKGDIPHRCATDANFARIVHQTTELLCTAGIYINFFCRKESDPDAESQGSSPPKVTKYPHAGKGFTINEMKSMLENIKLYVAGDSEESHRHATWIDSHPAPQTADQNPNYKEDPKARRYCENDEQKKVIKQWMETHQGFIDKAEQHIKFDPSKAALLDIPLNWCIPGVGYGRSCADRALQDLQNTSTSALFGLVNATRMKLFPGQFEIQQYQILYICKAEYIRLSEAVISVIAESYTDLGVGVNGVRAGGIHGRERGLGPQGLIDNTVLLFCPQGGRRQVSFQRSRELDRKALDFLNEWFKTEKSGTLPKWEDLKEENQRLNQEFKDALKQLRRKAKAMDLVELEILIERWKKENGIVDMTLTRNEDFADEDGAEDEAAEEGDE
jgi:hypothetical protein